MQFSLPYGDSTLSLNLDSNRIQSVAVPRLAEYDPKADAQTLVRRAMRSPIASPSLKDLARGCKNIVIIISDHTRPVPSKAILPPMLEEIREGSPDARVTLLVATGCHRETREDELRAKLGDALFEQERIVVHDCDYESMLVHLGTLPSGQPLIVNRIAAEADLLVAEGFIEPHFFAGFSGGRKSVLPGIAARKTVLGNHCAEFIDHPCSRTGVLEGNPIHQDMVWAARQAKLRYIVNTVLDPHKRVVAAFAGDPVEAHACGCRFLADQCLVKSEPADIVICTNGGHPLDQNIYQAVKGMTAAEALVKQDGVIIMLAKSADGHGGEHFYNLIRETTADAQLKRFRSRGRSETVPDQWQAQIFFRVLQRARILFLSDAPDEMVRELKMIPVHDLKEALTLAEQMMKKPDAKITIVPDGVSVIVG